MSPNETVDVLSNLLVQVATARMFARQFLGYVFLYSPTHPPQPMFSTETESSAYACIVNVASAACSSQPERYYSPPHPPTHPPTPTHVYHRILCVCMHRQRSISCVLKSTRTLLLPPPTPPNPCLAQRQNPLRMHASHVASAACSSEPERY